MHKQHGAAPETLFSDPESWSGDAVSWRNRTFLLFDRLPVPLAISDPYGRVLMANPAMAAQWGELPGRLRGRSAMDLFRIPGPGQLHPIADAVRQGRRSRYPVEVSWSTPSGAERYGELTVDLLADAPASHPVLLLYLRVRGERAAAPPPAAGTGAGEASEAELRILTLLAGGSTTARIAGEVGLTVDGVNYHVGRMSRRWGVRNRAALVAHAYVTGLLAPGVWPPAPAG
ncbi:MULTISPECIES: PAS domain-containing protein [unclassified Streptomyces]|uniref:PAS domain-containing protein n=1 Tax=unclassified Streptomyces TaxID=2593676 RepID=UPI002E28CC56|nr:PAS domain-containing protein [Streptomyces sp. NBC_01429]